MMKSRWSCHRSAFKSIDAARLWVEGFVTCYNTEHLRSAIGFVTPEDRHAGRDRATLAKRRQVYTTARRRDPERWSGRARKRESIDVVALNPETGKSAA